MLSLYPWFRITDAIATQFVCYMPFGEAFVDEHTTRAEMPFKFNGKEQDAETGLYYYGARYYEPMIAVWYGVDPLAERGRSWSPCVYCFNNPVRFIDPDGLWPWTNLIEGKTIDPDQVTGGRAFGMRLHPIDQTPKMHRGVDLGGRSDEGKGIHAAAGGTITKIAYQEGGAGHYVEMDHGKGYVTKYMHLQEGSITVKEGDIINDGEIFAKLGNTGGSTGPHLHFEIWKDGVAIDPKELKMPDIDINGMVLPGMKTTDLNLVINGFPINSHKITQGALPSFGEKLMESNVPIVKTIGEVLNFFGF